MFFSLMLCGGGGGVFDGSVEYNCENMYDSFYGPYQEPSAPTPITDFSASDNQYKKITFTWTEPSVYPPPSYDLYKNGSKIYSNIVPGFNIATTTEQEDTYYVVATNSEGSVTSNSDVGKAVIAALNLTITDSSAPVNLESYINANNPNNIPKVNVTVTGINSSFTTGDLTGLDVKLTVVGEIQASSPSGTALTITSPIELENQGWIRGGGGNGGKGGQGKTISYQDTESYLKRVTGSGYYTRGDVDPNNPTNNFKSWVDLPWDLDDATNGYISAGQKVGPVYALDPVGGWEDSKVKVVLIPNDISGEPGVAAYRDSYIKVVQEGSGYSIRQYYWHIDYYADRTVTKYKYGGLGGNGGTGQYYNQSATAGAPGQTGESGYSGGKGGNGGIWGTAGQSGEQGEGPGSPGGSGGPAGKAISGKSNIVGTPVYGNVNGGIV